MSYEKVVLSDSPGDYKLPFSEWWENQREVAEDVLGMVKAEQTIILSCPTAFGKSAIPALASKVSPWRVTTMVGTRDLQQQYQDSFDWFDVVWGRQHYDCILPSRIDQWEVAYGEKPSFADCAHKGAEQSCVVAMDCPYLAAKAKALSGVARVLNYHYAYYADWWRSNPGVVVCDEAHTLPNTIIGLTSIDIGANTRKKFRLARFPAVNGSSKRALEPAVAWVGKALLAIEKWVGLAKRIGGDERELETADTLFRKLEDIKGFLSEADDDEWYVSTDMREDAMRIRPVHPAKYASKILLKAPATILMSATPGNIDVLCGDLGLKREEVQFVSAPHVIPEEQRPIFIHPDAPRMSAKTQLPAYKRQADMMADIMRRHEGQKGVIHTASWRHAELVVELLRHTGRMMLAKGARLETIQKFREAPKGTVAVSPSWDHGLNFEGDAARFTIVSKVPFMNYGDPIVRLRLKAKGGRTWYDNDACLRVVQACGRIVRSVDDWGFSYILDNNWSRVSKHAPEWFKVQQL